MVTAKNAPPAGSATSMLSRSPRAKRVPHMTAQPARATQDTTVTGQFALNAELALTDF